MAKVVKLISSWDCCYRFSALQTSETLVAGFEPAPNLSSGFIDEVE